MVKRIIAAFFAGVIASIVARFVGGYIIRLVPGPSLLGEAILVGLLVAILAALLEKMGI